MLCGRWILRIIGDVFQKRPLEIICEHSAINFVKCPSFKIFKSTLLEKILATPNSGARDSYPATSLLDKPLKEEKKLFSSWPPWKITRRHFATAVIFSTRMNLMFDQKVGNLEISPLRSKFGSLFSGEIVSPHSQTGSFLS